MGVELLSVDLGCFRVFKVVHLLFPPGSWPLIYRHHMDDDYGDEDEVTTTEIAMMRF